MVVQAEKFIESLTPEEINVSAVEGSTAEEVWNMIDKNVVANYSDGSTANLVVSDWDYSNVKFDEPGAYVATGTLTLDGEAIEMTIPINVTITAEGEEPDPNPGTDKPSIPGSDEDQVGGGDWNWPDGSGNGSATGSGSGDKENPSSGDSSMIAGALAVLALSAGAAVVLIRKKK